MSKRFCQRPVHWEPNIDDILSNTKNKDINGLIFAADFEKAFDSVEHNFIFATLRKFEFGAQFINWIRILLKNNQSCVLNHGFSTGYFYTSRGTRQGDPISPYIFILVLEMLAELIRSNKEVKGITLGGTQVDLMAMYADDSTFFVADLPSLRTLTQCIKTFNY